MPLSPPEVEQEGSKDLSILRQSTGMGKMFTFGLNTAKNNDYIEKCFNQKSFKIIFNTKISRSAYVYLP